MKIALVSDAIYPYNKGGKETRIFELSTRLAEAGHDVHIYTMKWWDEPHNQRVENGVTLHAISPKYSLYKDEKRSIKQGILFGLACLRLLRAKFDVAEVDHMPYFPLFFMKIVCVIKRKPMIATWHEVWGGKYWREYLGAMGTVAAIMERLSVLLPNHIVAVSQQTEQRLRTVLHARQPITCISNGIDMRTIEQILPAAEVSNIVYIGRLLAHKHVDQLIKAVAILKVIRPMVRCLIISDGPERANLELLSKELGVTSNVIFKGFVKSDSDKLRLVKASQVFVLPSTREGFGLVALEAMACGLPVVTVNHPDTAARHLISPATGSLCEPNDPVGMAAAIEKLLVDFGTGDPAAVASTYDWKVSAKTLAEVYAK